MQFITPREVKVHFRFGEAALQHQGALRISTLVAKSSLAFRLNRKPPLTLSGEHK